MPYVVEYSHGYYARRHQIRVAVLIAVVALTAVGTAIHSRIAKVSKRVTYAEIVRDGTPAGVGRGENFAAPGLQASANRAFELQDRWDELKERHLALMPYMRLWHTPADVVTIVNSAVAGFDTYDAKTLLVPQSFKVCYTDGPRDWVGTKPDRPMKLIASAAWKTRRDYLPEEGDRITEAVTNLFKAKLPADVVPEVVSLKFPATGVAGEDVAIEFAFPTARRLPVSTELSDVTKRLRALHDELERMEFGSGFSSDEKSIIPLKNALGPRLRDIDAEYRRSVNPGAWLAERFPVADGCYGTQTPLAERVFAKWDAVTDARLPWRRTKIRRIVNGKNYVNHRNLFTFVEALPKPDELTAMSAFLDSSCAPLSGAIDALYFEAFDPAPASRLTTHATENLFTRACGTGLFPTNKISEKALRPQESLIVKFPTRYNTSGIRLPAEAFPNAASNQLVFSQWNYDYIATNAPVTLADVGGGLGAFVKAGYGYMPESVEFCFNNGVVAAVRISGLLPLKQEIARLKGGAK